MSSWIAESDNLLSMKKILKGQVKISKLLLTYIFNSQISEVHTSCIVHLNDIHVRNVIILCCVCFNYCVNYFFINYICETFHAHYVWILITKTAHTSVSFFSFVDQQSV